MSDKATKLRNAASQTTEEPCPECYGDRYIAADFDQRFPDWRNCVEALRGRGNVHAPDLIEAMAAEIMAQKTPRHRLVAVARSHMRAAEGALTDGEYDEALAWINRAGLAVTELVEHAENAV